MLCQFTGDESHLKEISMKEAALILTNASFHTAKKIEYNSENIQSFEFAAAYQIVKNIEAEFDFSAEKTKDNKSIIRIRDYGGGIKRDGNPLSAEELQEIIHPTFTTKNQGTGYGLSAAYNALNKQLAVNSNIDGQTYYADFLTGETNVSPTNNQNGTEFILTMHH